VRLANGSQTARRALPTRERACFATGVTRRDRVIEFRVLGPLEVAAAARVISIGGPKARAVLALLLLKADEVVSVERLIDEVWGDRPPPSAGHSLEAYVSRLRSILAGEGPTLVRQGAGYSLRLKDGLLDSRTFTEFAAEASEAAAENDPERAVELATRALALWRGPALADVALGSSSRAEAERLDELRLRVLEQRIDAELVLEREAALIGELQVLVAQNPYRERFVAQLMLALYRTGRHADALEVYEKTRGVLDDVGLQPSTELQQLSGQIVRQEPQLNRPASVLHRETDPRTGRSKARAVGLALGAALAAVMALTASGSGPRPATAAAASASSERVALVLPRSPAGDVQMTRYRDGVQFTPALNLTSETIVADEMGPDEPAVDALETRLRDGRFGLVIWVVDDATARAMTPLVRSLPATRFVFVDTSVRALSLEGVSNASAIRFAEEETSELVGYLSGLVPPRGRPARDRPDVVAVVGGIRTPQVDRNIRGFKRGIAATLPRATVLVDYANETIDRTRCEQIANSQIDRGADVVFAAAGTCGSGALAVARTRGVWGAGDEESASQPADLSADLLVRTHKEPELAVNLVLRRFAQGTLPAGRDLVLRLNDNYAVGLTTSWKAPSAAVSKMIERCSTIRRRAYAEAP
jgi:DNA-binding SARP family transcriptional activator/basic membrane lipoprotein Med (substrate-binding protein (PBP1-ABC) superfamily)